MGRATLGSLSTHTAGLPKLAMPNVWRRSWELYRRGTNPYGGSLDELLAAARDARISTATRPRYSNLGFELLGHGLAAAAGTTYEALVLQRVAHPLGLSSFAVPATPGELGPHDIRGRSARGRSMEPWTGEDLAPAGGIRSTIGDMASLTAALLDGSAPGVGALDPVVNMTGRAVRIGAAWITLDARGRAITWHNGGTGGFRTWMGVDREAGTGTVVLSATAASVDRHGFDILAALTPST